MITDLLAKSVGKLDLKTVLCSSPINTENISGDD